MTETAADPPRRSVGQRLLGLGADAARKLADTIMPARCLACKAALHRHDALCGACWQGIDFIRAPLCDRLGIPLPFATGEVTVSALALANPPAYDKARAVAHYTGTMRTMIHQLKFTDRHDGRQLLGRLLAQAGAEILDGADLIVPVPLSRRRLLWRRFNQAALLAREVGRVADIAFDPMVLARTRPTRPQVGLTHDQRQRNVAGAFRVTRRHRNRIEGRAVVLLDDVITTGATVEACARVLRRAGAARIDVLALALVTSEARVSV